MCKMEKSKGMGYHPLSLLIFSCQWEMRSLKLQCIQNKCTIEIHVMLFLARTMECLRIDYNQLNITDWKKLVKVWQLNRKQY